MNQPPRRPATAKKPTASSRQRSAHPNQARPPKSQHRAASTSATAPALKKAVPGKPVGLVLVDENTQDPSLGFEWQVVKVGANESCTCTVTAAPNQTIEARIDQPPYSKTLQNTGTLKIGPIPVGTEGSEGILRITNTSTGGTVEFRWNWNPLGAMQKLRPSRLLKKIGLGIPQLRKTRDKTQDAVAASPAKKAETRFFGIQAQGGCFAFILDISLSMEGARLATCKRELIQALNGLPEHASFGIFLYADTVYTPSGQKDWFHADPGIVQQVSSWVSGIGVKPYTRPAPAFKKAFSYATPPNVIFFLTDGELFQFTAGKCARITGAKSPGLIATLFTNPKSGPVPVIHTIALGDEASTGVLQKIAADHGGSYRVIASA